MAGRLEFALKAPPKLLGDGHSERRTRSGDIMAASNGPSSRVREIRINAPNDTAETERLARIALESGKAALGELPLGSATRFLARRRH